MHSLQSRLHSKFKESDLRSNKQPYLLLRFSHADQKLLQLPSVLFNLHELWYDSAKLYRLNVKISTKFCEILHAKQNQIFVICTYVLERTKSVCMNSQL